MCFECEVLDYWLEHIYDYLSRKCMCFMIISAMHQLLPSQGLFLRLLLFPWVSLGQNHFSNTSRTLFGMLTIITSVVNKAIVICKIPKKLNCCGVTALYQWFSLYHQIFGIEIDIWFKNKTNWTGYVAV